GGGVVGELAGGHVFKGIDDARDTVFGQRILVTGLRGGEKCEPLKTFVADQCLRKFRYALSHVDKVVDDAAFRTHHQVEIAQTYVEVDDDDILSELRQRCSQSGGRGGLSGTAFPGM